MLKTVFFLLHGAEGSTTVQMLPASHPIANKAHPWSKYNLAVSQQLDDEHRSRAQLADMISTVIFSLGSLGTGFTQKPWN